MTSFVGGVDLVAALGNVNNAQLLNPAASGVRAILRKVDSSANNNITAHSIRRHNTQLTSLNGNGENAFIGNAVSACELRNQTNATEFGTQMGIRLLQDTDPTRWNFPRPIVILPGEGIVVAQDFANTRFLVTFYFDEEPL